MTFSAIIPPLRLVIRRVVAVTAVLAGSACSGSPATSPAPLPLALSCPAGIERPSPGGVGVTITYAPPVAIGGRAPVTTTCTPASGAVFAVGATPVICTAIDGASQRATCGFTARVTATPVLSLTRFLAFGDSLTEGKVSLTLSMLVDSPAHSYPAKLRSLLEARYIDQPIVIINEGFGGERASESFARFSTALSVHRPEVVLLMHGVNDLNSVEDGKVQRAVDSIDELIRTAISQGMKVVVATLPPLGPPKAACPECVGPMNDRLRAMASARGAVLAEVHGAWGNRPGLMGADGIHPTEAGYEVIATAFFEAIRGSLERGPQ